MIVAVDEVRIGQQARERDADRRLVSGQFIIVDSKTTVNGATYYMTRDPYTGPRGVLSNVLDSAMSRGVNAIVIGK